MVSEPASGKPKKFRKSREWIWRVIVVVVFLAVGFGAGWKVEYDVSWQGTPPSGGRRLATDYALVSPLLTCSIVNNENFSSLRTLASQITSQVNKEVAAGNISTASVFVQDMNGGTWADVNSGEHFYPASLGKVPIMMAYLRQAESDPLTLNQQIFYPMGGADLNLQQEITPSQAIAPGKSYRVSDLISSMIDNSDNNAANLLTGNIDQGALDETYNDLGVPVLNNPNINNLNFMGVGDYSRFFRVLYNATYLTPAMSEQALETLTHTTFMQGIVAGVSASTTVAHKFGLTSIAPNGTAITSRELHDCGIVYAPGKPYTICIMTKSSSTIPNIEGAIADISKVVYQEVEDGYK